MKKKGVSAPSSPLDTAVKEKVSGLMRSMSREMFEGSSYEFWKGTNPVKFVPERWPFRQLEARQLEAARGKFWHDYYGEWEWLEKTSLNQKEKK